jgi:hypothetical protein
MFFVLSGLHPDLYYCFDVFLRHRKTPLEMTLIYKGIFLHFPTSWRMGLRREV